MATRRFYATGAPLAADQARTLFALAVVALVLGAVLSLPARDLWEPDEARIALVASETIASGNWLVPRLLGEPYTDKPPLYMWAVAVLHLAGLPWKYAAVLPSSIAVLALLFLVPRLAGTLSLGADVGRLGAAMLAAMPLVAAMGLGARMDLMLTLTFAACLMPLARLLGVGEPARRGDHLLLWLLIGIGILIKGPVALAMPAAVALTASLMIRPRPRLWPVFAGWGPLLALAVVLAWLLPAALEGGGEYLHELVVTQSAGRLVGSFAHRRGLAYHLVTFPATALPWSLVAIVAVVRSFRRRLAVAETFLATVVVALLVLFSLFSGKLVIYLLPAFPAVALLAAAVLQREPGPYRWALVAGGIGLALGGAIVLYRTLQGTWLLERLPLTAAVGAALLLGAFAASLLAARHPVAAGPAPLLLVGLFVVAVVLPGAAVALDPNLSARPIAQALARLAPRAGTFVAFGVKPHGAALLLGRRMREVDSAAGAVGALADGRCVVLSRREWEPIASLAEAERLALRSESARLRDKELLVVCPPESAQR